MRETTWLNTERIIGAQWLAALFVTFCLGTLVEADVKLHALFSDNMVLQREAELPVWGWASPGEEVTIEFAGQKKSAKADADGRWLVKLAPLPACDEGRELRVYSSSSREPVRKVGNVVVGEVWICSGANCKSHWLAFVKIEISVVRLVLTSIF